PNNILTVPHPFRISRNGRSGLLDVAHPVSINGRGVSLPAIIGENPQMTMLYVVILCGVLSVLYAIWATRSVLAADQGNARMQEISAAIREGAQAYLTRQYTTIAFVGVVVFLLAWWLLSGTAAIGFLLGAVLSGVAGFIGMHVSVRANVRTAQAASNSLSAGLDIAFKAGAITGLLVAGLALLGVAVYYWVLTGPMGRQPGEREVIDALV